MVKFANANVQGFQQAVGELQRWISKVGQTQAEGESILTSLNTCLEIMHLDHNDMLKASTPTNLPSNLNSTQLEESTEWFTKSPEFRAWLNGQGFALLWLHGPPGSGKTVLMGCLPKQLVHYIELSKDWDTASFFNCSLTTSESSLLASLIFQLVKGGPRARLVWKGATSQSAPSNESDLTNQLRVLLRCAVEGAQTRETIILIGGVHELSADRPLEFLKTLYFKEWNAREMGIQDSQGGTWLATHPEYTQFCDSAASDFLWIEGKPGSGKSTLAKRIARNMKERRPNSDPPFSVNAEGGEYPSSAGDQRDIVAEFYYSFRGGVKQTSHVLMLRSLVYQIWSQNTRLFPLLQDQYRRLKKMVKKQNEDTTAATDSLWTYAELKDALLCLHQVDFPLHVFIVVDGMDESDNDLRSGVVAFLPSLSAPSSSSKCIIKLLVASRPETSLNHALLRGHHIVLQDVNKEDIGRVIDNGIKHLKSLQKRPHDNDAGFSDIHEHITENAAGVFLWVCLVLRDLERTMKGIYTMKDLLKRARSLPKDLLGKDGFYRLIIDSMIRRQQDENQDDEEREANLRMTRRILTWVTFSEHPITIPELATVLAIRVDSDQPGDDGAVQNLQEGILFYCGGLVEVLHQGDLVQLIHQTAREFLMDTSQIASPYQLNHVSGDEEIAATCCYYLHHTFTAPSTQLEASEEDQQLEQLVAYLEERELLNYCLRYLTTHIGHLHRNNREGSILDKFEELAAVLGKQPSCFASLLLTKWAGSSLYVSSRWRLTNDLRSEQASRHCLQAAVVMAAAKGKAKAMEILVALGAEAGTPNRSRKYALESAARLGQSHVVKLLLDLMVPIDKQEKKATPLISAASAGHLEIVRQLIEAGCDINLQAKDRKTALHAAASAGHLDIVQQLIYAGADINIRMTDEKTALHIAASVGNLDIVRQLIRAGPNVNMRMADGTTALHIAASAGHPDIVQQLINAGSDVDIRTNDGNTALYAAASAGHLDIVRQLMNARSDINRRGADDNVALIAAIRDGYLETVRRLLDMGAGIHSPRPHETNLQATRSRNRWDIGGLLVDRATKRR
ncbi:hypothetical protein VHEMI08771 [[Torrubiella] hemipterigena]|nr:hypothetical protein VHEMI08771 [[Torrubiella] hemipterigena]